MNREEALKQIEQIQSVIQSTNRFVISGTLCVYYGVAILLIPLIQNVTQSLTFGMDRSRISPLLSGFIHAVFYAGLFTLIRVLVERMTGDGEKNRAHPLLREAMGYHRPFVAALGVSIVIFMNASLDAFIYPFVLLFFGVLCNIYGRLTSPFVRRLGWVTICGGLVFGLMAKQPMPSLWIWANTFLAFVILVLGLAIRNQGDKSESL